MNSALLPSPADNLFWSGPPPHLLDEDARSLIDHRPHNVPEWTVSRGRVYEDYARALRSVYNVTAPINQRLPPEIFMQIFASVCPRRLADISLAHVCRSWRAVLNNTFEFWADMLAIPELWDRREFLQTVLRLSGQSTFAVRAAPPDMFSSAWMKPHLHRIVNLRVASDEQGIRHLYRLLHAGYFANVKTLRLVSIQYDEASPSLLLGGDYTLCPDTSLPRLARIELSPTLVDPRIVVSSVQHLIVETSHCNLSWLPDDVIISPQILMHALTRCAPQLQTLRIHHALPVDGWEAMRGFPTLELPSLRELSISSQSAGPVEAFLKALSLPCRSSVLIQGVGQCAGLTLRHVLGNHESVVGMDELSLLLDYHTLTMIGARDGQDLLKLQLPTTPPNRDIPGVVSRVLRQTHTVSSITLWSERHSGMLLQHAGGRSFLDMFPNVTSLAIGVHLLPLLQARPTHIVETVDEDQDVPQASPLQLAQLPAPALERLTVLGIHPEAMRLPAHGLASIIESVLRSRRSVSPRPLGSLRLDADLALGLSSAVNSSIGDGDEKVASFARLQEELAARLDGLVDSVSVTGESLFHRFKAVCSV
ncbi:hypothetical protein C8Q77DRAFT_1176817 [Trametes polyzona]|nr:hypothetical protein C8Q77DRAFT_1176817 [Trametes polyzona]